MYINKNIKTKYEDNNMFNGFSFRVNFILSFSIMYLLVFTIKILVI